jgi:hypothetical protein
MAMSLEVRSFNVAYQENCMMSSVLARGRGRRSKAAGLVGILLTVVLGAMAPGAWALNTVPSTPTYTGGARFAIDGSSKHAVVEPSTGNLLVTNYNAGRIDVLQPDGTSLTTIDTGPGSQPYGIAVDPTSGTVYVSLDGTAGIARYTSDGAPVPTYTLDAGYTSPVLAASAALAIDPTTHDLLVANQLDQHVYRITPGGAQSTYSGAGSPGGAFLHPLDIAAAPNGHTYVLDSDGGNLQFGAHSRVVELDATDSPIGELAKTDGTALDTPSAVTVDASSGRAIVSGDTSILGTSFGPRLYVYDNGANAIATFEYPDTYFQTVPSIALAADPGRAHRLYSLLPDFTGAQTFDLSATPGLDIDAPTAVSGVSMHVSGTVNPSGFVASGRFEYSDDGGSTYQATPAQNLGSGSSGVAISADITGLTPVHDYKIRLVGTSSAGTVHTEPLTVRTTSYHPVVVTDKALDVTASSATLRGTLNPGGLQTTYHFEYGTSSAYDQRAPLSHEQVAGTGGASRSVSIRASELRPGTTYHFQLVAANSQGESRGADRTFTTATRDVARAYEQVSPVDKGGADVRPSGEFHTSVQPSSDGNAAMYETQTPPVDAGSGPIFARAIARREVDGWSHRSIDLPMGALLSGYFTDVQYLSRDLRKEVVISTRALADGAVEGDSNVYVHDTFTGENKTIGRMPGPESAMHHTGVSAQNDHLVWDASTDMSRILLQPGEGTFTPGAPDGTIYEWTAQDGLKIVSVDENGNRIPLGRGNGYATVTDDGHLLYAGPAGAPLYAREPDGQVVSVSHGTPTRWGAASGDGRVLYFSGTDLTNDSPPGDLSLYRYDVVSGQLTYIAPGDTSMVTAVSEDGAYLYFGGQPGLAPGSGSGANLYVWHNDAITHVASGSVFRVVTSPDGRYASVSSYDQLTSYDPRTSTSCPASNRRPGGACQEVYRYDTATDELTCGSCRPDGKPPTGHEFGGAILDDGTLFFSTSDALAATDRNAKDDVYSFDGSQATLISAGVGSGNSTFMAVAGDGRDVFFTTDEQLVPQDLDHQVDLYDARVGGGIPSQQQAPQAASCSGEACLGPIDARSARPSPGTSSVQGEGNLKESVPQSSKVKLSVAKRVIGGSRFTLTIKVPNRGKIVASGSRLRTAKRTATKSGTYKLSMSLAKSGVQRLRLRHRLSVKVRLTFTPTNATPSTTTLSLTLKG